MWLCSCVCVRVCACVCACMHTFVCGVCVCVCLSICLSMCMCLCISLEYVCLSFNCHIHRSLPPALLLLTVTGRSVLMGVLFMCDHRSARRPLCSPWCRRADEFPQLPPSLMLLTCRVVIQCDGEQPTQVTTTTVHMWVVY